ncbi:MAG: T9SS type A sorting domain-containing protein [Chitinophagaceae bacterium]|nr:T9SS type A sorting domain-containing protein [Chitinophagaceae bacterium]
MKKFIQYSILSLAFFAMSTSSKSQTVTGSYVPTVQQSMSNWCWAACTEMMYWAYRPGTIAQCTVVNKSKDREQAWFGWWGCNNLNHSSTSACSNASLFNSPQAMYGCDGSLSDILNEYSIPNTSYGSSLSAATLASNLAARKLMIARWGWNGGGGHFVVVNRYKSGYVYFNNPGNNSANTWTYSTFSNANGSGTWTHTLRMNNASTYGSTYYKAAPEQTITNAVEALSVNLYPNPATDRMNVLLNGEKTSDSHIIITDAVGKIVYRTTVSKDVNSLPVDVTNWNRGLYFVSVNGNKALSKTLSLR